MLRSHAAILVALALLVLGAISCGANETQRPPDKANRLREAVTTEGVMQHVRRFAEIAEENGGNRAAGTPGYDASAEYVADTLRAAGYEVTVEPFEFSYFEELEPARLELVSPEGRSYALNEEIKVLQYSGSGDATTRIRPVNFGGFGTSASGCEASDFEGFREGMRPSCGAASAPSVRRPKTPRPRAHRRPLSPARRTSPSAVPWAVPGRASRS